ncbi:hypothetical protein H312_02818 [Anncaliia algerae PRA339]|uniref:Clathrin/coatomer adaptor adaptin-like N-terminal domain-containing protein n=1 Tax=Anncaliia algerae PRA339 TaxID=1288291 RepID=A0A059EYI7_9MICR|nr:hypothetical protein H312_02818 [Anncaliia algerae PRA339]
MIESDPKLALFIMDLRSKSEEEISKIILKHRKDMAEYNSAIGQQAYDFYLRTFYLIANGHKVNEIDFIKAIGSPDLKVKKLGYLGSSFIHNSDMLVSMVNTVKNDLENGMIYHVLSFLGNLKVVDEEYQVLVSKLKELINENKSKKEAYVIYYKFINCISRMNLSEINEGIFFIKLQIIIDKFRNHPINEDIEFLSKSNEISNVIFILQRTKKFYIKTKCVQIFNLLLDYNLSIDESAIKYLEESVTVIRLLKRSLGEVAYYVECVEFLLKKGVSSQKTNTFLFKMLQSGNEYFLNIAIRLAKKYHIYTDIAIDKLITMGLETDENYDLLISMIDQSNYQSIYERREEIIMTLEGKDLSQEEIQCKINELINRILNLCPNKMVYDVFNAFPLYSVTKNVKNFLTENCALKFFNELKGNDNPEYFALFYQSALVGNKVNEIDYSSLLRHLEIVKEEILTENFFYLKDVLNLILILLFYKKEHIKSSQEILIQIYREFYTKNSEIKGILLENILLYNIFLENKTIFIEDDIFLEYVLLKNNLTHTIQITGTNDINQIFIYQNSQPLSYKLKNKLDKFIIELNLQSNNDLRIEIIMNNTKYINFISNIN